MLNRIKIAVIGASYLQVPLIESAKEFGYETHVFAWKSGDEGENIADFFYPISIVEKDDILKKCEDIGISGICSIASDLASITVNYVANKMGLPGNSLACTDKCTNKHLMRLTFENYGLPTPRSILVDSKTQLDEISLSYPVIVKPTDRSGSRGIYKVDDRNMLDEAVQFSISESFEGCALIESFIEGTEYSVEYLSYKGKHHFITITSKITTGPPHFIEKGHYQPADLDQDLIDRIRVVVEKALDALEVTYGASHSEVKVDSNGAIWLIEIGARMGGDLIGSHLVKESTGIDMVKCVIQIAMGEEPDIENGEKNRRTAAVRYIFSKEDVQAFHQIEHDFHHIIVKSDIPECLPDKILDSSQRKGYFVISDSDSCLIKRFIPTID